MPIEYRRRGRNHYRPPRYEAEPIKWLSMVPLAGVLAIAGALIASTYGIPPHAITVDLPFFSDPEDSGPLTPDVDRLVLTARGQLLWNGTPISTRELERILETRKTFDSPPALLFTPEADASYGDAIALLEILRRYAALDRCFRFSGIARYRNYENPETFDDLVPYQREDCPPLPPEHPMPAIIR